MGRAQLPYRTVFTTHPLFQARLLDNQEGSKYRTTRLRKALGEMFPKPVCLAPTLFQPWRYIDHGKSAQEGVYVMLVTRVYDRQILPR